MHYKDDDYFVVVHKILSTAYDYLKKGKVYDLDEIHKLAVSYEPEYWKYIFKSLTVKKYLVEKFEENEIAIHTSGYEITPEGIEYLFTNPNMKKLNK